MDSNGSKVVSFLANLNPFESLRKHIIFRHKRDQDHRFRDAAEARKLQLENEARELAILEKRVKLAKQMGATNDDLRPICNAIICPLPTLSAEKAPLLLTGSTQQDASGPPLPDRTGEDDPGL